MLKHLSDYGWDCFGVEVDPASSTLAKTLVGEERVFTGFLSKSPFLDGRFDLVLCVQTIEHVPDPFDLLLQMNSALRKGGILYIETPNFGGPSFRLLKDRWKNTLPEDHISMFTASTLKHFLRSAGFDIVSTKVGGCSYNARRDADGEYEQYKSKTSRLLMVLAGYGLRVLNQGDNAAFVCAK
jgi:SAM-dependent methyltransferase